MGNILHWDVWQRDHLLGIALGGFCARITYLQGTDTGLSSPSHPL